MPGAAHRLESGEILALERTPFELSAAERSTLLAQRLARGHKNISVRPGGRVKGCADARSGAEVRSLLERYSRRMTEWLAELLPEYAPRWRVDATSLRPEEERDRSLPALARNDLLHVDAFPSRPSHGDRILRVFTNVHPSEPRTWVSGETFERLLDRHLATATLAPPGRMRGWIARSARSAGLPFLARSPYDRFMLGFHDLLKQRSGAGDGSDAPREWRFPPGSSWILFSDFVSHAVRSGRGALEQTFFVPREALCMPERAPASILESHWRRSAR